MSDSEAVVHGTNQAVSVHDQCVLICDTGFRGRAAKTLRLSLRTMVDPTSIVEELGGPRRELLVQALEEDQGVADALLEAVREEKQELFDQARERAEGKTVKQLLEAFRLNRKAVAAAVASHKGEVAKALRGKGALVDIMLGKVVPLDEIASVDLGRNRDGKQVLCVRVVSGKEHEVVYPQERAEDFQRFLETVQQALDAGRARATKVAAPALGVQDLERLAKLRDAGVITESDFEEAKRRILGL